MDTSSWLLGLLGLVLFILGFPYLLTWAQLSFTRLRPIQCRAVAEAEVPAELKIAALGLSEKLKSLGLAYQGTVAYSNLCFDLTQESYSLVFLDAGRRVMACVSETTYPGSLRMFEVMFYSRLPDGRVLYTTDCYGHFMFQVPEAVFGQDAYSGDLEQQWRLHNSRLNHNSQSDNNPATPDQWSAEPFAESLDALAAWLHECYDTFFSYWLHKRIVLRPAAGVYFANPLYLMGFTRTLIRGQKAAIAQLQKHPTTEPPTNRRFLLERQLAFQRSSTAISKILLLVVSLVTFYVLFGFIFSWAFVPMLAVALLLHEYGHYLAMRYCGYGNTQIFFLPLLGAVTIGQKSNPTVGQELLIFLAGPVPGIILGLGLLFTPWVDTWPWVREFALVCFIVNFINLLPLVPLDGGRVVEKLLFARFAGARFAFYALSAAGFAVATWFTRDFILGFLAFTTAFMAKNEWRKRGILVRIQADDKDFLQRSAEDKRERILSRLCAENLNAGERFAFARDLLANYSGNLPTLLAGILGMVLYLGLLGGATAAAFYSFTRGAFTAHQFDDFNADDYYTAAFWHKSVTSEIQHGGTGWFSILQAVGTLSGGENPDDALEFIQLAEQQIENMNEPNLRLAEWRILKPVISGVPLVAQDVAYIRRNALQSTAENYEKANALVNMLDARALLQDADKIEIIGEALELLESDEENDPYLAYFVGDLYHRQGELLRQLGHDAEAKTSFITGFARETNSEFLMGASNYKTLLDIYLSEGQYSAALVLVDTRLAAELAAPEEFDRSESIHKLRHERNWLLLLTQDASASTAFASLLHDYQRESSRANEYDPFLLELILSTIYSHQIQEQNASTFVTLLHKQSREYIEKFIRGCNCKNRREFDGYRDNQYLQVLDQLGFSPTRSAN